MVFLNILFPNNLVKPIYKEQTKHTTKHGPKPYTLTLKQRLQQLTCLIMVRKSAPLSRISTTFAGNRSSQPPGPR